MNDKNELQTLQANLSGGVIPFHVTGVSNCQALNVTFYIHLGDCYNVRQSGKGVSIQKTKRMDWNEEKLRFDYCKEDKYIHIPNKKGLKAFKAWIDTLKPQETALFFSTKLFNY